MRQQSRLFALLAALLALRALPPCTAFLCANGTDVCYTKRVMVPYKKVGGVRGVPFDTTTCDTSNVLEIIKRIKVWTGRYFINGIWIETTQGRTFSFGTLACDAKELEFKHTANKIDRVLTLSLWDNCGMNIPGGVDLPGIIPLGLGGIKMTTSSGNNLDIAMKCQDKCVEYPIEVGGGIPCGIFGRASPGAEIYQLGFSFMKPDTKVKLQVNNTKLVRDTTEIVTVNGGDSGFLTIDNRRGVNAQSLKITESQKLTTSETLETTSQFKFSNSLEVSTSFKFKVAEVVEGTVGVKYNALWEQVSTRRVGRTTSSELTISVDKTVTCPPFFICDFFDYVVKGSAEIRYRGAMVFLFIDGASKGFTELGTFSATKFSNRRIINKMERPRRACLRKYPEAKAIQAGLPASAGALPPMAYNQGGGVPAAGTIAALQLSEVVKPTADHPDSAPAIDCSSGSHVCPTGAGSTPPLLVRQATLPDAFMVGLADEHQLEELWRGTAHHTVAVFLTEGCALGHGCSAEHLLEVVWKAPDFKCIPGASVVDLGIELKPGFSLALPEAARDAPITFKVEGTMVGRQCTYAVRVEPGVTTSRPKAQGMQGLDALACIIGMAKCRAASLKDVSQCCVPMPTPHSPKAPCGCPSCFPGHAQVLLSDGSRRAMRQLKIGDRVQVMTAGGRLAFQPIYLFGHKDGQTWSSMNTLEAAPCAGRHACSAAHGDGCTSGNTTVRLTLSSDHFVPVLSPAGNGQRLWARAGTLKVGDCVWAAPPSASQADSEPSLHRVTSVGAVHVQGLYNPFTPAGIIVVDSVVASVHSKWFADRPMDRLGLTTWIPTLYQAILLPAYYTVYCTLGPAWVRWLDDRIDFASTGTDSPLSTLLMLWAYIGLALASGASLTHRLRGSSPAK